MQAPPYRDDQIEPGRMPTRPQCLIMEIHVNDQNPPSTSPFQSIRTIDYTVILVRDMAAMRRFYERSSAFR